MDPDDADLLTIRIASASRYARVARTVVASCASLERFSADQLGDVRLLVDTAFHAFAQVADGAIEIRVRLAGRGSVTVTMSAERTPEATWSEADRRLLETLASVLAVERSLEEDGAAVTLAFTVSVRTSPA